MPLTKGKGRLQRKARRDRTYLDLHIQSGAGNEGHTGMAAAVEVEHTSRSEDGVRKCLTRDRAPSHVTAAIVHDRLSDVRQAFENGVEGQVG